jgi:hypothetical protein
MAMALVGVMALMAALPVLGAGPSRFQWRDSWAIETIGPDGPLKFIDQNGDGVLGIGDRVDMSRGHFTMINFAITGPATVDLVDPTRPGVTHIDGVEKRFDVTGVDPATGALTLASRAFRIVHAWRDYNGLLGIPISFVFFRQNIIVTGQINQGVFFVVQPVAPIVVNFPGAGAGPVIIPRPCDPSPNQDNPCNP